MIPLAAIAYSTLAAGIWIGVFGLFALSRLLLSKGKRDFRWGRRGRGTLCSTLSIFVWGGLFTFVGAAVVLKAIGAFEFGSGFLLALCGAAVVLIACAVRDSIADTRSKTPNHVPDPTFSSGTSPAGQEPRHR